MKRLIVASQNRKKIKELASILEKHGYEPVARDDAGLPTFEIVEDGTTFEENSYKKAHEILKVSGEVTLGDDSGLMVDYLNGEPGLFSSRYAGMHGREESDLENNKLLLEKLEGVPFEKRTAKFVTVITVCFPDGETIVARGECPGYIAEDFMGEGGFGYDPLFIPEGYAQSFAQLGTEYKNTISHRARALDKLEELLEEREKRDSKEGEEEPSAKPPSNKNGVIIEDIKWFGRRVKEMFFLILNQFQDPYYQGFAAQIAFSLFLSIVPIFILLSQILGMFSLSIDGFKEWLVNNLSIKGADILFNLFDLNVGSSINSLLLVIIALWAASRAQFAMIRITNYTLTDTVSTGKSFVRDRARSILTMFITLITIGFALVVLVYGDVIATVVFEKILGTEASGYLTTFLRWPFVLVLFIFMISAHYYFLPTERVRYRDIIPGSVLAGLGFLLVTYGYSIYVTWNTNSNALYGSLSSIIVLMFWFWFLAWVMIIGVSFNRVWWVTRKKNAIPLKEEAISKRKPINIF